MKTRLTIYGTLMHKNVPLCEFEMLDGFIVDYREICQDAREFPIEMHLAKTPQWGLSVFLNDRVVPSSRQGLEKDLARIGMKYYDVSELTKRQNASSCEDDYWVRFETEGSQSWEELRKRIGLPV